MDSYEPSGCRIEVGGLLLDPRGYFAEAMDRAKQEAAGPRWDAWEAMGDTATGEVSERWLGGGEDG